MDSLFTNLQKYRLRDNNNPIENFVTEAFAWLLRKDTELGRYLINQIAEKLDGTAKGFSLTSNDVSWSTQENYSGVFPDMEAKWSGMALVFEHKVWSPLHGGQLKSYREFHEKAGNDYRLILITGHHSQHSQKPDLALCWHEVYVWIKNYVDSTQISETTWVINDFLQLLKSEGLGPTAPISHTAIWHYQEAVTLRSKLENLIGKVYKQQWLVLSGYCSEVKKQEGVIGIQFNRINPDDPEKSGWNPGVFVGFALDGGDHKIQNRMNDGLKMILNISISKKHHAHYSTWLEYISLIKELDDKAKAVSNGWTFYNHREEARTFNPWHPLYLEYPMLELFQGTEEIQEQETRFKEMAEEVLDMLMSCSSFKSFERKLNESVSTL
jgi:hypothetical protein